MSLVIVGVVGCGTVKATPDAAVGDDDIDASDVDSGSCPDADGDTVCDANDICAGSDDRVDTDSDTRPDGCDTCPTNPDPNCATLNNCVIRFDDAYANGFSDMSPDGFYAPFGVHFDNGAGYGVIGGEGNGDPGNWDIEGTNGSAVWGLWENGHGIVFDADVTNLSIDWMRAFNDFTLQVDGYNNGSLVQSQVVTPTGAHDHRTMTFTVAVDQLVWNIPCCYGADNIVYTTTLNCP
jgi:hypothetical protein